MGKTEKFLLEATEPQTASQIAKATGLSTAAIYKWVGRATAQETVTRTSKGYTLTRKARESLHG
jgi:DNA-binding IclR family transcriptional regulator